MDNTNKIISSVFWRISERICAQIVSFVVSVLIARILIPEDYSVVAILNVFVVFAEVFVNNGLGASLIQKKEADNLDFSSVLWFNVILSWFLYGIVFVSSPFIEKYYSMKGLSLILRVFSFRIPISAINSIQHAYIAKKMDFKKFFFSTIIGTIISAIIGILMAKNGYGVWSLIIQILSNSLIDTIILSLVIDWKPQFIFSVVRLKPLLSFGWKILAISLVGTFFNQFNSLVIGKKYTKSDLGYYSQGKKIPDLVSHNILSSLSSVLFPALTSSKSIEELQRLRTKILSLLKYIIYPILFGLIAVSDNLILCIFTDKWKLAIPFLRISSVNLFISVIGITFMQELKAIGRSDVLLKLEFVTKPIFIIILFVFSHYSVFVFVCSLIINELIDLIFKLLLVKKYVGYSIKENLRNGLPSFIMSVIMCGIVYCINFFIRNVYICLSLQIFIGVCLYILMSLLTKNKNFKYLINFLKTKIYKRKKC